MSRFAVTAASDTVQLTDRKGDASFTVATPAPIPSGHDHPGERDRHAGGAGGAGSRWTTRSARSTRTATISTG